MTKPKFKVGDVVRILRDGNKECGEIRHYTKPDDTGVIDIVYFHCPGFEFPQSYDVKFPESSSVRRQAISETCLEFAGGSRETKSSSETDCILKLKAFMDSI